MPKLDLLCATIWGSGVLPGGWGSRGFRGITGCSGRLRGVLGDYGEFAGMGRGGFRMGSGFYRHPLYYVEPALLC